MKRSFNYALPAMLLAGCTGLANVPCEQSSNCNLFAGGTCLAAASGNTWCAYPDPACAGGYRYSDQSVGDGLSGMCVVSSLDAGVDSAGDAPHSIDAALSWSQPVGLTNVNSAGDDHAPAVSTNGLELYFWRGSINPPYGEIFVATRTNTGASFSVPVAVTAVNGNDTNENGVLVSHTGLELFITRANVVMVSSRPTQGAAWSAPASTTMATTAMSLSSDDLHLYLVSRCDAGHHGGNGPCLFRADRTAVGQSWSQPSLIDWPGASSNQWNYAHVSGDERRILLSNPYSGTAIRATEATRAAAGLPWSEPSVIDALSLETTNGEMRWNAAEDTVYLTASPAAPVVGGLDIYVSVLQ